MVLETKISSNTLNLQVSEKCKNLIIHIQGPANLKGNDEVPEASSQIGTAHTSPGKNLCSLIIQMHLERIDFRPIELSINSMGHFVGSWSYDFSFIVMHTISIISFHLGCMLRGSV